MTFSTASIVIGNSPTPGNSSRLSRTREGSLNASVLVPHGPNPYRLGVKEHHVPAIVARDSYHPLILGQIRLAVLQESPDVGGFREAPPSRPTSRAMDKLLRAHPSL